MANLQEQNLKKFNLNRISPHDGKEVENKGEVEIEFFSHGNFNQLLC